MEITTKKSLHPLTMIAAVSITLFSLVGIGAITGLIPTSHSQDAQAQLAKPAESAQAAEAPAVIAKPVSAAKPAKHKVAATPAKTAERRSRPADEPVRVARTDVPVTLAQTPPPPNQTAPVIEAVKPVCRDCGVIESVREIEKKGEGSGLGAAVGGIAGGVLGHQTGGGRGKDVMTVLGAIGGAFAGNAVEKNTKKVKSYEIDIRFDDGTTRLISQDTVPAWRIGDRVRVVNSVITPNNS